MRLLTSTQAYNLSFLYPEGDEIIGPALRDHGEFARAELELLSAYMDFLPRGTLIDVGANIGSIALPLAAGHRDWRVMAYEGHRGLHGVLAANAFNNRLYNVEAIHGFVGPKLGIARFSTPPLSDQRNFGAGSMFNAEDTQLLLMSALDDTAPDDTRLIKIDVEGAEHEVLRGALKLLERRSIVWLFEAKPGNPGYGETLQRFIGGGYRLFWFFAPFTSPDSYKAPGSPIHYGGDFNCLALPGQVPNLWGLEPVRSVDDEPPGKLANYPYLGRYGYDRSA